jgi:hypothetical protein
VVLRVFNKECEDTLYTVSVRHVELRSVAKDASRLGGATRQR